MDEELIARARETEEETRKKISTSISKIEVALASWEGAEKKPKAFRKRIENLRKSHKLMSGWAKESLKGKKDFASTVKRLQRFTEMCSELRRIA